MERAARVLRKAKQSKAILDDNQALQAVWPVAVGKAIARHVTRLHLVRSHLIVEVEDMIWQRQLRSLQHQILERLHRLLPDVEVTELEFRIGVPRREAQKATSLSGSETETQPQTGPVDEAEAIKDPGLKRVYLISRRKASA
jgi:hypothetical protein